VNSNVFEDLANLYGLVIEYISNFFSDMLISPELINISYKYTSLFEVYYVYLNNDLNKYDTEYIDYAKSTIYTYINTVLLTSQYSTDLEMKLNTFRSFIKVVDKHKEVSEILSEGNIAKEMLICLMKV